MQTKNFSWKDGSNRTAASLTVDSGDQTLTFTVNIAYSENVKGWLQDNRKLWSKNPEERSDKESVTFTVKVRHFWEQRSRAAINELNAYMISQRCSRA